MKQIRSTGNNAGDNTRRICNWIRGKLVEYGEDGKKKYSQAEAAEYIGISQPNFSEKLANRNGGFNLQQLMGIIDYFGESEKVKDLF